MGPGNSACFKTVAYHSAKRAKGWGRESGREKAFVLEYDRITSKDISQWTAIQQVGRSDFQ